MKNLKNYIDDSNIIRDHPVFNPTERILTIDHIDGHRSAVHLTPSGKHPDEYIVTKIEKG